MRVFKRSRLRVSNLGFKQGLAVAVVAMIVALGGGGCGKKPQVADPLVAEDATVGLSESTGAESRPVRVRGNVPPALSIERSLSTFGHLIRR